jgi:hypothetical protein
MSNGKQHPDYGLYGEKGGWVVFADGHCKWLDGNKPAKFLKWDGTGYTTDIRQAVPNNAFISSGFRLNSSIKIDTDVLIIYNSGTGGDD